MMARVRRGSAPTTADPAERAREIALRILGGAPRSAAQLRDALIARDVSPAIADEILSRYRQVGLVDDDMLAAMIARSRVRERAQAPRAIAHELRRKGFEPRVVEAALAQIPDDDVYDRAAELALRVWQRSGGLSQEARARRIVGMLARRGHSPSTAFALVRRLEGADTLESVGAGNE